MNSVACSTTSTPHHFHFAGSSVLDEPIEDKASFPAFLGTHRMSLRAQYAASGGQPNPVIFLESGERVRGFVAFDGESMADFTERLTRGRGDAGHPAVRLS